MQGVRCLMAKDFHCLGLRASATSTSGLPLPQLRAFDSSYPRTFSVESLPTDHSLGLARSVEGRRSATAFSIACSPTTAFPYASIPDCTKAVIKTVLWWLSLRGDSSPSVGSSGASRSGRSDRSSASRLHGTETCASTSGSHSAEPLAFIRAQSHGTTGIQPTGHGNRCGRSRVIDVSLEAAGPFMPRLARARDASAGQLPRPVLKRLFHTVMRR